jgi:glycosyltransferase involved in cell wall biosynthesis
VLEEVDVIIGHGHITGLAARRISERHRGARLVHIVHTDPERVASFKATAKTAGEVAKGQDKRRSEEANCAAAHVVCGVGPKLREVALKLLQATDEREREVTDLDAVLELLPGAIGDEDIVKFHAGEPQILTLGRLDDISKGMDLFAKVVRKAGKRRGGQLRWVLRGVRPDDADTEQVDARSSSLNAIVRPYTPVQKELASDLRTSAVVCMASREEGFGLVAFEAIVRGIPVLVGRDSGIGQLLEDIDPWDPALVAIDEDETALRDAWVARLLEHLVNVEAAFGKAEIRRREVLKQCDWRRTAQMLLDACR